MSLDAVKNFAYTGVAVAPAPALSGTSLTVSAGAGSLFPAVPFNATVWPAGVGPLSTNAEIVRVTNIAGDVFTITRAQEGTAARTILAGDQFAQTITALLPVQIAATFVTGPASATNGNFALFDGAGGKLVKDGGTPGSAAFASTAAFDPAGAAAAAQAASQPVDADLTDISALTPTDNDLLQRKSSVWTNRTPAQVAVDLQGDGMSAASVGFRGVPQIVLSGSTTVAAADNGKSFDHTSGSPHTITIDSEANLALPIGFTFSVDNGPGAGVVMIAITDDTLILASDGSTGSVDLAANGVCTVRKTASTVWKVNGTGLT